MSVINTLFYMGKEKAKPVPIHLLNALKDIEVQESSDGYSGFQLNLLLGKELYFPSADYKELNNLLAPFNRVAIGVNVGNRSAFIMDGLITHQALTKVSLAGTEIKITGKDMSVLLDKTEKNVARVDIGDQALVKAILKEYSGHGIAEDVKAPRIKATDQADSPQKTKHQCGTDLAYIRQLAEDNAYAFAIKPTNKANISKAYWGPKEQQGEVKTSLVLAMESIDSNVKEINFAFDALKPELVSGHYDDGEKLSLLKPKPEKTGLAKKTVLSSLGTDTRTRLQTNKAYTQARNAQKIVNIQTNSSMMGTVVAEGSVDTFVFKDLLRAGYKVKVRGAGNRFNGWYYIDQVTHKIARESEGNEGSYQQDFRLIRESVNAK